MRLALGQLNSRDRWERNLATLLTQIAVAKLRKADAIFFPENALFMGSPSRARRLAPEIARSALPKIRAAAGDWKIAVLLGSFPEARPALRRVSNTSLFIDESGKILARYRKIHLFDVRTPGGDRFQESKTIAPGKVPVVFNWRGIRIGMSVCFDIRYPEMYRKLSSEGAEWLLIPSAFTFETGKAHWRTLATARAIENLAFVFAPAQSGRHPMGRRTFGHSLAIDPWGTVLAEAGDRPGVTVFDVDPALPKALRRRFPVLP